MVKTLLYVRGMIADHTVYRIQCGIAHLFDNHVISMYTMSVKDHHGGVFIMTFLHKMSRIDPDTFWQINEFSRCALPLHVVMYPKIISTTMYFKYHRL